MLEDLLPSGPSAIVLCPQTPSWDLADEWMSEEWTAPGIERVVLKSAGGRYRLGGRTLVGTDMPLCMIDE